MREMNLVDDDIEIDTEFEFEMQSETQLIDEDLPPINWLIDEIIPKPGLVGIVGEPGVGKTFFIMWLLKRMSNGVRLFDEEKERFSSNGNKQKSWFIIEDDAKVAIRDRLMDMPEGLGDNVFYSIGQNIKMVNEKVQAVVDKAMEEDIDVVVIDPFSTIMQLENENDNAEVAKKMDLLRQSFVNSDLKATLIFIHHKAKGEGGSDIRGAGDIKAKCDMAFSLSHTDEKDTVKVSCVKPRLIKRPKPFWMRLKTVGSCYPYPLVWEKVEEPGSGAKWLETAEKLLEKMKEGNGYSNGKLAELVNLNRTGKAFQKAKKHLLDNGKIIEEKSGRWPQYYRH